MSSREQPSTMTGDEGTVDSSPVPLRELGGVAPCLRSNAGGPDATDLPSPSACRDREGRNGRPPCGDGHGPGPALR